MNNVLFGETMRGAAAAKAFDRVAGQNGGGAARRNRLLEERETNRARIRKLANAVLRVIVFTRRPVASSVGISR
jgi:hypothetical protein